MRPKYFPIRVISSERSQVYCPRPSRRSSEWYRLAHRAEQKCRISDTPREERRVKLFPHQSHVYVWFNPLLLSYQSLR